MKRGHEQDSVNRKKRKENHVFRVGNDSVIAQQETDVIVRDMDGHYVTSPYVLMMDGANSEQMNVVLFDLDASCFSQIFRVPVNLSLSEFLRRNDLNSRSLTLVNPNTNTRVTNSYQEDLFQNMVKEYEGMQRKVLIVEFQKTPHVLILSDSLESIPLQHKFGWQQVVKRKWLDNRLDACKKDFIPIEFYDDKFLVLDAVSRDGMLIATVSDRLRSDKEVALVAMSQNAMAHPHLSMGLKFDRDVLLAAVKQNGEVLKFANHTLNNDKELVMEAVKQNSLAFQFAGQTIRNDREIILSLVRKNLWVLKHTSYELMHDMSFLLELLQINGLALQYFPTEFKSNKSIVLEAVKQNGHAFQFAAGNLDSNKEVILEAIKLNVSAIQHASSSLRTDEPFVFQVLNYDGHALAFLPQKMKNKSFLTSAVLQSGKFQERVDCMTCDELSSCIYRLKYFKYATIHDRDTILQAIKKDGLVYAHIPQQFKSDKELILEAVTQNASSIQNVSKQFMDKEICLAAVKQDGMILQHIPNELRDREICLVAVKQNGMSLKHVPMELRDKQMVFEAVTNSKMNLFYENAFDFAPNALIQDREFVLELVKRNGLALKSAAPQFKEDEEILMAAIHQNGNSFYFAPTLYQHDKQFVLKAVKQNLNALRHANQDLRRDKQVVMELVKQNGMKITEFNEFKSDKDVVLEAVKQNVSAFCHASNELKADREFVLQLVKRNASVIKSLTNFQDDSELILEAIKQDETVLSYLEGNSRDKQFALQAVKCNPKCLRHVSTVLQYDFQVQLEAAKCNGFYVKFSQELYRERMNDCYPELYLPNQGY